MRRAAALAVLFAVVSGAGCATIVHGPRQSVTITSDPSGATVTVLSNGAVKATPGVTPVKVKLPRRDANLTVRLEKAGCQPAELPLKRSVSGWVAGNLIAANPFAMQGYDSDPGGEYAKQLAFGVPALFAIDFLSGGAYKLPKAIDLRFCSPAPPQQF